MATEYSNGISFRAGPRKLLLEVKDDPLPPAAPGPTSAVCRDMATNEVVRCNNANTVVMVLAGMACMVFLIGVALGLLCWSVVKQRRHRRAMELHLITARVESRRSALLGQAGGAAAAAASAVHGPPVDSVEFDDAVLVQLPGDAEPQFFALPKPFLVDAGTESVMPNLKGDDGSVVYAKADCGDKDSGRDSEPPDAPPPPPPPPP